MFSTDFIFRQQENFVDNQKCQAGFRLLCKKILKPIKFIFLIFFAVVSSPEHVCDQNRAQVPGAVAEQRRSVMDFSEPENTEVKKEYITREIIDDLVLKTLGVIRLLVDK